MPALVLWECSPASYGNLARPRGLGTQSTVLRGAPTVRLVTVFLQVTCFILVTCGRIAPGSSWDCRAGQIPLFYYVLVLSDSPLLLCYRVNADVDIPYRIWVFVLFWALVGSLYKTLGSTFSIFALWLRMRVRGPPHRLCPTVQS